MSLGVRGWRCVVWLLGVWVGLGAAAAEVCEAGDFPRLMVINYEAHAQRGQWFSLSGEVSLSWRQVGENRYRLDSSLAAAGVQWLAQRSEGLFLSLPNASEGLRLQPETYDEQRAWRKAQQTRMDWAAKTVSFANGAQAPLEPAMQDRISALMQLAFLYRSRPQAQAFEFPVASRSRLARYRFVRHEAEPLELPIGKMQAVRFERADDDGDAIEVWLAPGYCALPVRVRWRDRKGYVVEQWARSLKFE